MLFFRFIDLVERSLSQLQLKTEQNTELLQLVLDQQLKGSREGPILESLRSYEKILPTGMPFCSKEAFLSFDASLERKSVLEP